MAGTFGGGLSSSLPVPHPPACCAHLLEVGTVVLSLITTFQLVVAYRSERWMTGCISDAAFVFGQRWEGKNASLQSSVDLRY